MDAVEAVAAQLRDPVTVTVKAELWKDITDELSLFVEQINQRSGEHVANFKALNEANIALRMDMALVEKKAAKEREEHLKLKQHCRELRNRLNASEQKFIAQDRTIKGLEKMVDPKRLSKNEKKAEQQGELLKKVSQTY